MYGDYLDIGIAPAWRPREGTEVRAYYGVQISPKDRSTPFTFVEGTELPPHLPNHLHGQKWAAWKNRFYTMGLFGHTTFGQWRLSGGLFRHIVDSQQSYNTLFVNAQADGSADFLVNIHPPRTTDVKRRRSPAVAVSSTKARATMSSICPPAAGPARGDFGGEEVVDFGPINVGEVPPDFPEPDVEFGEETKDKARQVRRRPRLSRPLAGRRRVQRRHPEDPLSQDHRCRRMNRRSSPAPSPGCGTARWRSTSPRGWSPMPATPRASRTAASRRRSRSIAARRRRRC